MTGHRPRGRRPASADFSAFGPQPASQGRRPAGHGTIARSKTVHDSSLSSVVELEPGPAEPPEQVDDQPVGQARLQRPAEQDVVQRRRHDQPPDHLRARLDPPRVDHPGLGQPRGAVRPVTASIASPNRCISSWRLEFCGPKQIA